jgi:hypothetical protein
MGRGLEVVATLQMTVDDRTIDLTADGSRVRVEIGDLTIGRWSPRLATSGFALVRRLSRVLVASQMTLHVTRNGRQIVELGAGVRGGAVARLLGIACVRIGKPPS